MLGLQRYTTDIDGKSIPDNEQGPWFFVKDVNAKIKDLLEENEKLRAELNEVKDRLTRYSEGWA